MIYKKYIPTAVVIHHEAFSNGFASVNEWHKVVRRFPVSSLGYNVGYQYYIEDIGKVWQAREETEEGMHTLGGWNRKSVGVCLMGNLGLQKPTEAQNRALKVLVEQIRARWNIPLNRIYGHKELWLTACPGKYGMQLVESIREVKPDIRILEKQIALLIEAIEILKLKLIVAKLKVAIKALLKKRRK